MKTLTQIQDLLAPTLQAQEAKRKPKLESEESTPAPQSEGEAKPSSESGAE